MVACSPTSPLKRDVRFDHELGTGIGQALGHVFPLFHGKHGAEMAHGHIMRIHGAGGLVAALAGRQVGDDLVAVEIEVDPFGRAAALGTAELTP